MSRTALAVKACIVSLQYAKRTAQCHTTAPIPVLQPTNDLDVDTLRCLEDAILRFAGTVMIVSHDRWCADTIRGVAKVLCT